MTKQIQFTLNLGNMGSGYTATEGPLMARPKVWRDACQLLKEVSYTLEGGNARIEIDWRDVRKDSLFESALNAAFYGRLLPADVILEEMERIHPQPYRPQLNCLVSLSGIYKSEEAERNIAAHVLELFLYDLFCLLNLSAPGSCLLSGSFKAIQDEFPTEVNLESLFLELAWSHSVESTWPPIGYIQLGKVIEWKNHIGTNTRQIASSRTERALFALLQLCKGESYNAANLIWLSHSLEALYDTPVTLIGQFLQKRIMDVLSVPAQLRKDVKKQCNSFYDLRSKFVHGSLAIAHPLENEILDPTVNYYRNQLSDAIQFGTSVCLSTLQLQIQNNWREITFQDVFSGMPFE